MLGGAHILMDSGDVLLMNRGGVDDEEDEDINVDTLSSGTSAHSFYKNKLIYKLNLTIILT